MTSTGWKLWLLLTLGCSFGSCGRHSDTLDYVVSIVLELAKAERGVPNCVFYNENNASYHEGFLGQVLRDPRLKFVSKTVFRRTNSSVGVGTLLAEPMVVIIQEGLWYEFSRGFLLKFKPSTKVIVTYFYEGGLVSSVKVLKTLSFYNTIFISGLSHKVTLGDIEENVQLNYRPRPSDLFKLTSRRNMHGKPITFITRDSVITVLVALFKWLELTASFMNTTAIESNVPYDHDDCHENVYFLNYFYHNNIDINLSALRILPDGIERFDNFYTKLQIDVGLLVPKYPLTVLQLFTLPFSWQVWLMLIVLFILIEVLHLTLPTIFQNEPILMVICGYEKFALHKAGRWEKMILLSMVVLTFFAIHAYETKLVSMMTRRPASKQIKTLADFHQSGIKVKVDHSMNLVIGLGNTFAKTFENESEKSFSMALDMDHKHAYVCNRNEAWKVLPLYYDPVNRMNRYSVVDQSLGQSPVIILAKPRTPLMDAFSYTLNCCIESGIYNFWEATLKRFKAVHKSVVFENVLNYSDFAPAWLAYLVGSVASVTIFSAELFIPKAIEAISTCKKRVRQKIATIRELKIKAKNLKRQQNKNCKSVVQRQIKKEQQLNITVKHQR